MSMVSGVAGSLQRLASRRGVRAGAACLAVVLAVAVGLGTLIQRTAAPTPQASPAATCSVKASGSACYAGGSLIADSVSQAANAARGTPTPTPQAPNTAGQPCQDRTMFVARITQWTVPPGCYGTIYTPNPKEYSSPTTFGYCNWWVEALHPKQQDILLNSAQYHQSQTPVVGAAMWFDPGVQGASPAGHWAQVVAIAPEGYWLLVTEMNFGWRGGGFGKVDYRYAHAGPGVKFVY